MPDECKCLPRPEEGIWYPGTIVTYGCEAPGMNGRNQTQSHLKVQEAHTIFISSDPRSFIFKSKCLIMQSQLAWNSLFKNRLDLSSQRSACFLGTGIKGMGHYSLPDYWLFQPMLCPFIVFVFFFKILMKYVLFSQLSRQGRGSESLWALFKVVVREWQSLFSPLGLMSLRT